MAITKTVKYFFFVIINYLEGPLPRPAPSTEWVHDYKGKYLKIFMTVSGFRYEFKLKLIKCEAKLK